MAAAAAAAAAAVAELAKEKELSKQLNDALTQQKETHMQALKRARDAEAVSKPAAASKPAAVSKPATKDGADDGADGGQGEQPVLAPSDNEDSLAQRSAAPGGAAPKPAANDGSPDGEARTTPKKPEGEESTEAPSGAASKPAASSMQATKDGADGGHGLASSEDHKAEPEEEKTEPLADARVMELVKQGVKELIRPIATKLEEYKVTNDALRDRCDLMREEAKSMARKIADLQDNNRAQDGKLRAQADQLCKQDQTNQYLWDKINRTGKVMLDGFYHGRVFYPGLKKLKERTEGAGTSQA